jgi:hypothetical protein
VRDTEPLEAWPGPEAEPVLEPAGEPAASDGDARLVAGGLLVVVDIVVVVGCG